MTEDRYQQLICLAVETELLELLGEHAARRVADGRAGVVRNGYLPERELQMGLGPVTVGIPKVRAKTGEPVTFRSALVPPYVRKTRTLKAALPWLYLKGISSGEMGEALKVLVGLQVTGDEYPQAGHWRWSHGFLGGAGGNLSSDAPATLSMHKTMNVLNGLPKSAQPKAKQALHAIWQADPSGSRKGL